MNQLSENLEDPSHPYHHIWQEWYRRANTSFYSHEDPNSAMGNEDMIENLSTVKKVDHPPAITYPSSPPPTQPLPAGGNDPLDTDLPALRASSYPSIPALPANMILSGPFSRLSVSLMTRLSFSSSSPDKDKNAKQDVQSGVKLEEAVKSMKIQ
jgi:hypothetical protein